MGSAASLLAGDLAEQRRGLDRGEASACELVTACLDRMTARAGLGAVVFRRDDAALALARSSDERIAEGKPLSPLDGLPSSAHPARSSPSDAAPVERCDRFVPV